MLNFDVIVIGAGLAGLCASIGLARLGYRIGLIELQSQRAIAEPGFDGRKIALTHRSMHLLQAGLRLANRIGPSKRAVLSSLTEFDPAPIFRRS